MITQLLSLVNFCAIISRHEQGFRFAGAYIFGVCTRNFPAGVYLSEYAHAVFLTGVYLSEYAHGVSPAGVYFRNIHALTPLIHV